MKIKFRKLEKIKRALINKAESFLYYIAKGDEGLTRELNKPNGTANIIKGLIVCQLLNVTILLLWVVL